MALQFHKTPIVLSAKTLKNLVLRYKEYTSKTDFSTIDEENYEKCRSTIALLQSGLQQVKNSREKLEKLYTEIREELKTCKTKSEKKDLAAEIEQIEEESSLNLIIAESEDLSYMLTARLDEAKCARDRMNVKLGYITQKAQIENNESDEHLVHTVPDEDRVSTENGENSASSSAPIPELFPGDASVTRNSCRSIKPPQATLPKFYGNAQDFPEFWAVFDTLVHKSTELHVMEKILLLKESLKGRAQNIIKGIKLIPENYNWLIQTLQENYYNQPVNRSQIIQKLVNMRPATNSADNCAAVLDQIQVLINQMISAGYDVRKTCDPIWCETIIAKFPQDVVKPVLISGQSQLTQTTEELMGNLKKEIAAKLYIENRLGHTIENKPAQKVNQPRERYAPRPQSGDECVFCHKNNHTSMACRTVTDQSSRRKSLKEENRCWKCCSRNHNSYDCQKPDCPLCGQKHHPSICFKKESNANGHNYTPWYANQKNPRGQNSSRPAFQNKEQRRNNNDEHKRFTNNLHADSEITKTLISQQNQSTSQLVLMTVEGNIWNFNKQDFEKVLFFFDSGAQKTVIEEKTASDLGLPKYSTEICTMSGIGGHIENFKSDIVLAKLSTAFGEEIELKIQTKPVITNGFPSVKLTAADVTFLKENSIYLANSKIRGEHQKPHILVGLDYYHELISGPNHTLKTPSGLQITKTVFGPTVYGKGLLTAENLTSTTCYGLTAVLEQTEQEILQKMFELDGLGISEDECHKDDKVQNYSNQYSKLVSFKNGHVIAPFPLKDNISLLEDNYCVAIRRLESLLRTLQQNPEQQRWYGKIIQKYVNDNTIENFLTAEKEAVGTYYMPHSGVWKPSKQVPLRVVFDASSRRKNRPSLNDVIYKGESFINKIHDILVASRTKKIILMCDIEAAFTQIHLVDSHKDLCRFLWVKNVNLPPTKENLVHYRFKRLPFGVTASPSILNMVLASFLNSKDSKLAKEIASNLYVDNIMMQAETPEEAIRKYSESKKLFKEIGMNLREYISNSNEVNSQIPEIDQLKCSSMKLLGVRYDREKDSFIVTTHFPKMEKLTKKDIVSQINSVYDPIGMSSPLLIQLKSLMREVFDYKTDWKTNLAQEICHRWNNLTKQVDNAYIIIPRLITGQFSGAKNRLWAFADASGVAMSTCAYLQCELTGTVSPLISGKTRLTPKKIRQTIPRLELVAILMAARLSSNIVTNYKDLHEISIVSDSEIALCWLKSSKKLPLFVENQCKKILEIKNKLETKNISVNFFHVATAHNPADAGTRGLNAKEINESDWLKGPRWLENCPETWPLRKLDSIQIIPEEEELITLPNIKSAPETVSNEVLFDLGRYSNLSKTLRIVAQVGKATHNWVQLTNRNRPLKIELRAVSNFTKEKEITSTDIELAERIIITQEQSQEDFKALQKRFLDKKLVRDENNIIRHESRLQNSALPRDTKSPIFVPSKSELVRLIVQQIHRDNAHCGKEHTLTIARQKFWIPRASNAFKKYVKNCVICKKYQGLPLGAPMMPALPKDRVVASKPFENTGCDFMGPFTSKSEDKIYVALYTCLTTRAVHLEVVENMTTGAFLNSFIRFISRRGVPRLMRTDCGTNFKQGEQIIATMFENDESSGNSLMSYCATKGIKWLFNPPASPWMGGVWERLVASVKKALNKSVGRKRLSFTEMSTIMARIEAILNTRPLTKLNPEDVTKIPLRPVDFLQHDVKFSLPKSDNFESTGDPSYDPELIQSREQALEAIRNSETISDKFWECWRHEYLTSLREMQKQLLKQPRHLTRSCPEIGEIVLIEQDLIPRGNWPYGRVTEIITSADGFVRSAKILMPNRKVIHRPLNKIYPLEIRSMSEKQVCNQEAAQNANEELPTTSSMNKDPKKITVETRQSLPRASKVRAYDLFRNMDGDSSQSYVMTSISSSLVFFAISLSVLISPTMAINNSSIISCSNGVISVPPIKGWFELCIDNDCQSMNNTTRYIKYLLPISPTEKGANVHLRTLGTNGVQEQHWLCDRPKFCEHQYIFSKSLLGNPHCWPAGAIATSAVLIYLVIAALMFATWVAVKITRKMKSHRSMIRPEDSETEAPSAPACSFELTPLPSAVIALCTLVCLVSSTGACQYGFMRHSADLVCNENNRCHLEYSRELLFNRLQSELCIEILHANKTVGSAKFVKKAVEFECSKVTEFFTRPTKSTIYQSKRCANAGSCIENKCDRLKQNETVPELIRSAKYPGYSGCMNSCGGMFCGCFLPLPSCWFYKIAHRPVSDRIFEISQCPHWTTTVKLDIEITIVNLTKKVEQSFIPYIATNIDNFNVTVISIQRPLYPLENKRFAISKDEAYMLPPNFKLPVACSTPTQALQEFNTCSNRVQCSCGSSPYSCQCPHDSFHKICENPQSILPLKTPHANIMVREGSIVATSNEEEMVLRIESKMLQDVVAELTINQECGFKISKLTGCYDCTLGAHFTAICKSSLEATVTVTCQTQQFLVKCGPSDEENEIILHFNHPTVHEQCSAHCSDRPTKFLLNGTLHYHLLNPLDVSAFGIDTHGVPLKHQWFSDITIPNIDPLLDAITGHWKLTLAAIGTVSGLLALTYFGGPMMLLYLFASVNSVIINFLKFVWNTIICCWDAVWVKNSTADITTA